MSKGKATPVLNYALRHEWHPMLN